MTSEKRRVAWAEEGCTGAGGSGAEQCSRKRKCEQEHRGGQNSRTKAQSPFSGLEECAQAVFMVNASN